MPTTTPEHCANCGALIGRLETPCVWKDEIVCVDCHERLARHAPRPLSYSPPLPLQRKHSDPLKVPRLILLLVAIFFSFGNETRMIAGILWGAWLFAGIIGLAMKNRD